MVEPVACALEQPQMRSRLQSWRDLCAQFLGEALAMPDGVRLDFAPDPAAAHRLLDLVAAERECCGWAEWTVTSTSRRTRLDVVAEGAGPQALQGMFEVS